MYILLFMLVQKNLMIPQLLGVMGKEGYGSFIKHAHSLPFLFMLSIQEVALFTEVIEKAQNAIFITQSTWACSISFGQDIVNILGYVLLVKRMLAFQYVNRTEFTTNQRKD